MSNLTPEDRKNAISIYHRTTAVITIANVALWLCRLPKIKTMELTNGIRYEYTGK